ncbi:MAG TPA: ATP-binding protein [Micropepsaceae bacterium]|nr:ATP-binding protein [Micropepsaceae bacterium]
MFARAGQWQMAQNALHSGHGRRGARLFARPLARAGAAICLSVFATPARAADAGALVPDIITGGILALGIAAVLLTAALLQRTRARERRLHDKYLVALRAAAQREQALIAQGATLYVWPLETDVPAVHGPEPGLLSRILDGGDAAPLALALAKLREEGDAFTLEVRDGGGIAFRVLGRIVGREPTVVVWPVAEEPARPVARRDDLEAMMAALPVPAALRDWQGKLRLANSAYVSALGIEGVSEISNAPPLIKDEERLAADAAENTSCLRERRYAVVNGQRRAFTVTASPAPGGALITLTDATEIDDALSRLQRHIEAHDETLDRLKTAVVIFGPDKRLIYHNHAYADLWRLDTAFLAQKPDEGEILERLRAERRLPEQRDFAKWKRGRAELYMRAIEPIEETWHLPDATTLRVVVQPHPFGGLLQMFEDVTSLITLEANYNSLIHVQRSTLDYLDEGVALFGTDGRLKLYNPAFLSIWRLDAAALDGEPHADRVIAMLAPLSGGIEVLSDLHLGATGAGERRIASGRISRTDNFVVAWNIVPLPDGANLVSFLDITDSVDAERNLLERNAALVAADKLKTSIVAQISDKLRTPLNTVHGFVQALQMGIGGELPERARGYLDAMFAASSQLNAMVDNIIDLAAIDSGAMELSLKPVEVTRIIKSAEELMRDRCDRAGLLLNIVLPETPGLVMADEARMTQVLFNLLDNAIRYTPGGGTVTLGAEDAGDSGVGEGAAVRFFVIDTGPGIPPELQPKVFERFSSERVGGNSSGPGLGLPLVERIIKMHGGMVLLDSVPGRGTSIYCYVPRAAAAQLGMQAGGHAAE